jgi:hypothetical protein
MFAGNVPKLRHVYLQNILSVAFDAAVFSQLCSFKIWGCKERASAPQAIHALRGMPQLSTLLLVATIARGSADGLCPVAYSLPRLTRLTLSETEDALLFLSKHLDAPSVDALSLRFGVFDGRSTSCLHDTDLMKSFIHRQRSRFQSCVMEEIKAGGVLMSAHTSTIAPRGTNSPSRHEYAVSHRSAPFSVGFSQNLVKLHRPLCNVEVAKLMTRTVHTLPSVRSLRVILRPHASQD